MPTMTPPLLRVTASWFSEGRRMVRWSPPSRRLLAHLQPRLAVSLAPALHGRCAHLKGHGGVKGALRYLQRALPRARYVARFDVAAYYNSIRHDRMLGLLGQAPVSPEQLALVGQYLALPDTRGTGRGLVASGSLSPLLGALYLAPLDRAMWARWRRGQLVAYVRYMDDVVLLAATRWQLRRAIAQLQQILTGLGLRTHSEKLFIGPVTRGFDFLGYRLHPRRRLRASRESIRRLRERARRLYEREGDLCRLRQYVERWYRWLLGGLGRMVSRGGGLRRLEINILRWLGIGSRA